MLGLSVGQWGEFTMPSPTEEGKHEEDPIIAPGPDFDYKPFKVGEIIKQTPHVVHVSKMFVAA